MRHIRTIIRKEWADVRRNRMVLSVVVLVPLLMVAIPVIMLAVTSRVGVSPGDLEEMGKMLEAPMFRGMGPVEAMQSALASSFLVLFLMMPLMVPVTIAAYSIVGEKVTRSLEPLLATPITTTNLMLGKGLAAALPGVVMAWLSYGVFLIFARFFAVSDRVFRTFLDPMWLVAMFVLAPLLTILAVNVGIIISSRTSDPRAAEQLGSLLVLPLMALFIGPMAGVMQLSDRLFWITSLIVAVLDVALLYIAVALFQRETILTRWK
jgi:ABC-2 type transport system permease protein